MPGKYIYVLDDRPQDQYYWRHRTTVVQRDPKEIIQVNQRWEVERICRRIRSYGAEGILILYLVGEGKTFAQPAHIQIGQNLTQESVRHFAQLRGLWVGEYPRIEVHACYVASEQPQGITTIERRGGSTYRVTRYCIPNQDYTWCDNVDVAFRGRPVPRGTVCQPGRPGPDAPGHVIMQALANAAGVTVKAGVDYQYLDWNFAFEGRVQYYRPVTYYRRQRETE